MPSIPSFQRKVLTYYKEKGRDLPWRKTTDPYKIMLSEIMLQQTQVDRVISYFNTWTKKWPTIHSLANAQRTDVLNAWMGLGYNNRAIRLHEAAKVISTEFNGDVLNALRSDTKIPGIGPYTKAAVLIFSANEDLITVDTNIRRILIHEFSLPEKTPDQELWDLSLKCLPHGKSRDWHNALMDYGATHLTAKKTGIKPKTQQSTFEGSDRQLRAKILKHLLKNKTATASSFAKLFSEDTQRIERIVEGMRRDGLIEGVKRIKVK